MANVEGDLYNWLLEHGHNSPERAHKLASLLQISRIRIPHNMRTNGKLVNFFLERPAMFGVVYGSDEAQNPSIYAVTVIREEEDRGRGRGPSRGRGGIHNNYQPSRLAQEILDAEEDAEMVDEIPFIENLPTNERREYDFSRESPYPVTFDQIAPAAAGPALFRYDYGGKKQSKSKSKSRSTRKSRSRKNRIRRSKSKSRN